MKKKYNENYSPVGPTDVAVGGSPVEEDPVEERPVITVAEAASILGVSARAIYALVREPYTNFPSMRLGMRILIPRKQFNEWLQRELAKPSA